jgi:hypothetical protein
MAVLKRMTEWLSQTPRFSVTRQVVLRRPDHLRVDATTRDGAQSTVLFDGKDLTVVHPQEHVYATAARPGSVDEAIVYFVHDLGMRLPLAEMLTSQLAPQLMDQVRVADYVEASLIAGVPCDHLAFRGDEADMQVWVAQGPQPLPRRVVITYRHADGQPQFWAQFSDWNLAPAAPEALFTFTPPAGATQIAFSPRQQLPGAAATTGGQQR